jgi:vacuolar-type H+-ATPase subunit I/STV1
MAPEPRQANALSAMLSDINTRINDLEEKQNITTEKISMLSQTLLNTAQRLNKDSKLVNEDLTAMKQALQKMRDTTNMMIEQSGDFVRRQEVQMLDKYMKNWQPMKFATIEDVKKMISDAIKNKHVSSKDRIIKVEEE